METQKNDEKNIVLELKHQLGRMMVQVDYMYRNDREMSRLDLDVMMERTRDLYDLLCDYQVDKDFLNSDKTDSFEKEINEGGEIIKHDVELEIETPENVVANPVLPVDEDVLPVEEHDEPDDKQVLPDEEPVLSEEEEIDDEDWEDEEDETFHIEPINEDDYEDSPMIVAPQEEKKPVEEDNSLAARLHRTHVSDIRAALGINDKMMIINDLFKGSFERYNKSIEALNEFPTLSGAKIYMSELQIELQWDTESQAYTMLNDLVERRFI